MQTWGYIKYNVKRKYHVTFQKWCHLYFKFGRYIRNDYRITASKDIHHDIYALAIIFTTTLWSLKSTKKWVKEYHTFLLHKHLINKYIKKKKIDKHPLGLRYKKKGSLFNLYLSKTTLSRVLKGENYRKTRCHSLFYQLSVKSQGSRKSNRTLQDTKRQCPHWFCFPQHQPFI